MQQIKIPDSPPPFPYISFGFKSFLMYSMNAVTIILNRFKTKANNLNLLK